MQTVILCVRDAHSIDEFFIQRVLLPQDDEDVSGRDDKMSVPDFARALAELQEAYAETDLTDAGEVEARDAVLETAAAGMGLKDHPLYADFKKGFLIPPSRTKDSTVAGSVDMNPAAEAPVAGSELRDEGGLHNFIYIRIATALIAQLLRVLSVAAVESEAAALLRKVSGPTEEERAWVAAEQNRLRCQIDKLEAEKLRLCHEAEVHC
eukprot:SAG31_NODE_1081_length_10014_cov_16.919617_2_plen_208_part_00